MNQIKLKFERAREFIQELRREIRIYFDNDPYKISTKRDPKTRRLIYYVEVVKDVPPKIQIITGDTIQNLRSSLDHLAYRLFIVAGGSSGSARHVYFPISPDKATFDAPETQKKIASMTKAAISIIHAAKPYHGGNDVLWQLHQLNNIDKHRLPIVAASSFKSMDIAAHMQKEFEEVFRKTGTILPSVFVEPEDQKFPLEVGDILFIDKPDAEPNPDMNFNIRVAIHEPSIIENRSLVEVILEMAKEVEGVLDSFKGLV